MTPDPVARASIRPLCQLCTDFGRVRAATVRATVPMFGERPRYPLCDQCVSDVAAFAEDIEVLS